MREFVAGYGPAMGGEGNTRLEGVRQTTNAAAIAPGAGATLALFAAGEVINVRTRIANEQVRATLTVSRQSLNLGGNAIYQFTVDGAPAGGSRRGPIGTSLLAFTLDEVLTVAAAGAHTIGAQVTGQVAAETVSAGAVLVVEANEFAAA